MFKIENLIYSVLTIFVLLTHTSFAQSGNDRKYVPSDLFYYYGNQRIGLFESRHNLYIQTRSGSAMQALKQKLKMLNAAGNTEIRLLSEPNRSVVTLVDSVDFEPVYQWLQQQSDVLVVRAAVYAQSSQEQLYEDGLYVKLKPDASSVWLESEVIKKGGVIAERYAYDKRVYLIKAGGLALFNGLKMANELYESGKFEYAEPDFRPLTLLHSAPNDSLYFRQWAFKNTGTADQFNGIAGADINAEGAWTITKGSPLIRIAVIDEGVERMHPDLQQNIDPMGFGLTPGNATTGSPLGSARSHGTSCAGIIAAQADNISGTTGIAPLCKIIPVNLTVNSGGAFGTSAQIASCIDWAWSNAQADILSNSWGGGTASSLIHDAIKRATTQGRGGKGALVFFSSGNTDAGVTNPAIFPETVAVGAMDMCYQRKSINTCDAENFWGSSYGTGLDIAAPGVKIATTTNTGYRLDFNGTSSACPLVAGVAALVLSVNSSLTQAQVREILERTATKAGNYTYSRVPGQPNGTWTPALGYGMVNAYNAVMRVADFDFDCEVSIMAQGPVQFCQGGSVQLQVSNVSPGSAYTWLRNGMEVGLGNIFVASSTGQYQAIIQRPGGCSDTSASIQVNVPVATGALVADAGKDTTVCSGTFHVMGGGPAAQGGTPFLHHMRGLVHEYFNNNFIRYDAAYPAENYRIIKSGFNPDFNMFYAGAAATPYGLYMLARNNKLVKVDTATGQVITMGTPAPQSGFWQGMTYSPFHHKIFAISSNDVSNLLYEIDFRSGRAVLLGTLSGASNMALIWLAADATGKLYAMRIASFGSAQIFNINPATLSATALPQGTGFQASFAQDGAMDLITGKLMLGANTRAIGSGSNYPGHGVWEANTTTGNATLIGSLAQPYTAMDAMAFSGYEYTYSWSPATYLSNPKDANPIFTGAPPGTYTYTLTVTDLCGLTAQSTVTIVVNPIVTPNVSGVLFVKADATGNNSGSSWANAITSLQDAIQFSCQNVNQIWVAKGTYQPTSGNHRNASFNLRNNLAIYGGFAGNESFFSQRNLRLNPTVLSGDIGIAGNSSDNVFNVISLKQGQLNNTAILDGFTITNGQADKNEQEGQRGGGMYILNSSPLIRNCTFSGNFSALQGGAVYVEGNSASPVFVNCIFTGNQAQWGGAIYNQNAQTRVVNCTFSSNSATQTGGAFYSYGTALATIRNSIIWGNSNSIVTATADNSTPAEAAFSLIEGGYPGQGNYASNPLFFMQAPIGLSQTGDLRIMGCSQAMNNGSSLALPSGTTTDIIGNTRSVGNVDMGAYERTSAVQPAVIFVDASAIGMKDGTSWSNAYTSLHDALKEMNICGVGPNPTIQIAAGGYTLPAGVQLILDKAGATLLGGYPPGGGTRNAAANLVIIKGDVQVLKNATIDGVRVEQ